MLQRVAVVLLLLIVSSVAAIFAAGHLGINLPWTVAVTDPDPSSKDREETTSATAEKTPEAVISETTDALGGAAGEAAPGPGTVGIDISRISPDGTSVFAGRAAPDSYVTVLENGKPAGTAKTDSHGEWSLSTEHKFASTDPKLSYEVSQTPPPVAEPPKTEVAKAQPAPASASAAGEVMRKFENLVEEAREEAKSEAAKAEAEKAEAAKAEAEKAEAAKAEAEKKTATLEVSPPATDSGESAVTAPSPEESAAADTESNPETQADATVTLAEPPAKQNASAGVKTDIIPVPLMFVYNEATLTPEGERAAALLLEYLTLKRLSSVELTGHADERGTDDYNYDLSRERLDAVSQILKTGGYTGQLTLTPKGKSEPYTGVNRTAYRGEALYQLDRRVELRVTR